MQIKNPYFLSKLNATTYLIKHNDSYTEFPFIYVKLYSDPALAVIWDTGVGADQSEEGYFKEELKDFIDTNVLEWDKQYEYMVISTHVHFDHIGGMEAFYDAGADIVASGYDPDFVAPENRAANSLCANFNVPTPQYEVSQLVDDRSRIKHNGRDLGLVAVFTPGHTPDSLAVFDEGERFIMTGDTVYRRIAHLPWGETQDVPIILVLQSNWKDWVGSLQTLADFIKTNEYDYFQQTGGKTPIQIAAGHTTDSIPAGPLVQRCLDFTDRVVAGNVPIIARLPGDEVAPGGTLGDAIFVFWQEDGDPEFSLIAPEDFIDDF